LTQNPELAPRLGTRDRETVIARYSVDVCADPFTAEAMNDLWQLSSWDALAGKQ